jgi:hypothetical protein
VFRFFKNFQWVYVIVDERIPVDNKTFKPLFGHSVYLYEMWVSLIEKAYAKLHGCYANLISGYIDEGIQELTGFQPEKVLLRNEKTGVFPHKMIDHYGGVDGFWDFLVERKKDKCLMGCNVFNKGKNGPHLIDAKPSGLILNHAYSILDVIKIPDYKSKDKDGGFLRLLLLRNPWGSTEWNGDWSGDSE